MITLIIIWPERRRRQSDCALRYRLRRSKSLHHSEFKSSLQPLAGFFQTGTHKGLTGIAFEILFPCIGITGFHFVLLLGHFLIGLGFCFQAVTHKGFTLITFERLAGGLLITVSHFLTLCSLRRRRSFRSVGSQRRTADK